jgi:hypothetical protein
MRMAVACTAAMVSVALVWTCAVADAVHDFPGPHRWWIPGDAWIPVLPAHFVAEGAFPFLYEAHPGFTYPPGIAVLLAPLAAIGEAFHLSESTTIVVQRPAFWLLLCPVGVGCALFPLASFRRLAVSLHLQRRVAACQVALAVLCLAPVAIVWGHYEELIVIGATLEATRLTLQGRHRDAAWMLGLALLFKQTALLMMPVLLVQAPRSAIRGCALRALAPAVALCGICLAADWPHGISDGT